MERTEVRKDLVSVLVEVRYLKKLLNFIEIASLFFLEKCLCRSDDVLSIKNGVSVRLFTDTGKYTLTFWCSFVVTCRYLTEFTFLAKKDPKPKGVCICIDESN